MRVPGPVGAGVTAMPDMGSLEELFMAELSLAVTQGYVILPRIAE